MFSCQVILFEANVTVVPTFNEPCSSSEHVRYIPLSLVEHDMTTLDGTAFRKRKWHRKWSRSPVTLNLSINRSRCVTVNDLVSDNVDYLGERKNKVIPLQLQRGATTLDALQLSNPPVSHPKAIIPRRSSSARHINNHATRKPCFLPGCSPLNSGIGPTVSPHKNRHGPTPISSPPKSGVTTPKGRHARARHEVCIPSEKALGDIAIRFVYLKHEKPQRRKRHGPRRTPFLSTWMLVPKRLPPILFEK